MSATLGPYLGRGVVGRGTSLGGIWHRALALLLRATPGALQDFLPRCACSKVTGLNRPSLAHPGISAPNAQLCTVRHAPQHVCSLVSKCIALAPMHDAVCVAPPV